MAKKNKRLQGAHIDGLFAELDAAERAVEQAREAIIQEIRTRLGAMTPYQFAAATGINRGNLYNLVSNGKWNATVAAAACHFLSTPITDAEWKPNPEQEAER